MTNGNMAAAARGKNNKSKKAFVIASLIVGFIIIAIYAIGMYIAKDSALEKSNREAANEKQKRIAAEDENSRLREQIRQLIINNQRLQSRATFPPKTNEKRYEKRGQTNKPAAPKPLYTPLQKNSISKPVTNIHIPKTAIYPKYSSSIQLKSDSKITLLPDNRLNSNAPIFGKYEGAFSFSSKCGEKYERELGLHKECYIMTLEYDRLYFNKGHKSDFDKFNHFTSFVECNYNKKHGLMQDCKVWSSEKS